MIGFEHIECALSNMVVAGFLPLLSSYTSYNSATTANMRVCTCVLYVYWMGPVNSRFTQDLLAYIHVCFKCGILFQGLVLSISEDPVH